MVVAWEATLRKILWAFRERPRFAWAVLTLAISGTLFATFRVKRLLLGGGTFSSAGPMPSAAAIRAALEKALRRASAARALVPLATKEAVVLQDAGVPVRARSCGARGRGGIKGKKKEGHQRAVPPLTPHPLSRLHTTHTRTVRPHGPRRRRPRPEVRPGQVAPRRRLRVHPGRRAWRRRERA